MARCSSQRPVGASLPRRGVLFGGAAMALSACAKKHETMTASRTPVLDVKGLDHELAALIRRAQPGILGFGLMNLESGQRWVVNGDRRFPMQSVFKAALGAAALAEVDAGRLSPAETITLDGKQLSPPHSPIADAWPGRTAYTVDDLLTSAVSDSDNTAADVLMKRIGGPGAVTAWLHAKNIADLRIDRYERELQPESHGMASFREGWKGPAFAEAMATVPPQIRARAQAAYMADPRDTTTPNGMLTFLSRLDAGELISAASTRKLITIMARSPRGPERLKAGLPKGASFAHKIGTSSTDLGVTPVYNDIGIFTLPDRRSYAVAAFLTGSTADEAARAALLADLGRAAARAVG